MRKVIKKSNYVITYTTAWDDSEFATVAMTASAIGAGHARVLDLTVTSANVSGNLGVECVTFTSVINTDIGTGEDGWLGGYAVKAHVNVTATGAVGNTWLYGVYSKVEVNTSAVVTAAIASVFAEVMVNAAGSDVYGVYIINNGTQTADAAIRISGNFTYGIDFAQVSDCVSTSGDITAKASAGFIYVQVGTAQRWLALYGP